MESVEEKWTDKVRISFKNLPGNFTEQCKIADTLCAKGLSVSEVSGWGGNAAYSRNYYTTFDFTIPKKELDRAEKIFAELNPKNSFMPLSYYRHYKSWDKIDGEEQIVGKVNEILKEAFGKNVSGNWVIVLGVDDMYKQSETLGVVVKNGSIFEECIGYFEIRDGSRLVLRPALFFGFWRRKQAEKYRKLYRERFGKEAFVEFPKS